MKKSVLMTLIALVAITMFAFGCKKEENVNTDTATTDTAMLPKNRLGRKMLKKLKVYRGTNHPHTAQKPESLKVSG